MNILSKLCGCFLVLALLLAGCSIGGKFDPETATDYAEVGFHPNHWELTNAEGQKLFFPRVRTKQYKPSDDVFELGGDMDKKNLTIPVFL